MGTPGPLEIGLVLLIVLIFVGPKKLPGLGKSLGTGLREFKDSVSGDKKSDHAELEEHRQESMPTPPPVAPPVAEPTPLTKPDEQPAPPHDGNQ
ncbi:MAG: twin-arginine translocase TatA/TatE family subunit [Solirubrobacteraceae bacterium]|nr:twin-arginine translocase TatA/TatE family subunit [Solirubrobacteraceae bacterium]